MPYPFDVARDRVLACARPLAFTLTVAIAALPLHHANAQSATDSATAEALFNEAISLLENAHPAEACGKLEESQRLDPGVGTLLYLADCYQQLGRTASAWATFRDAAYMAKDRNDERQKMALEHAQALDAKLSYLTLEVAAQPGVPVELKHDGKLVGEALWGTPFPVDPGKHVLLASAPGKQVWSRALDIVDGQKESVVVPALSDLPPEPIAIPTPAAPAKAADVPGQTQATVGWVLVGVGSAAIVTGGVLAQFARADDSDADAACRPDRPSLCDAAGVDLGDSARTKATWAGISAGVGLAALGAGVTLLLMAPTEHQPPTAQLSLQARLTADAGSVSVRGSW